MLKTFWAILGLLICGLVSAAHATDNYSMADGSTLSGDIITFNDAGIILRLPDDKYTERLPWTKFSQQGLQQLAQNPKIRPLVDPFIEIPATEKVPTTDDIKVHAVNRLALPAHQFVLGALASSSVGLLLLFLIYAANLYAAYEVAACRGRPIGVVMGVSAILPVIGPIIFFLMPTNQILDLANVPATAEGETAVAAAVTPAPAGSAAAAPAAPAGSPAAPTRSTAPASRSAAASSAPAELQAEDIQVSAIPVTPVAAATSQSFKRGQFTFNRRFFETKFTGFIAPVRSDADAKLELTVKLPQTTYVVQRITQLGTNDANLEVIQDGQVQEILVPFKDIQEITIKTKAA